MNILLWICQGLLAFGFGHSGYCKTIYSREKLLAMGQTGLANLSVPSIRLIGIAEMLGAAGIILPWWLQVFPFLTPVTAICFGVVMILAARLHYVKREMRNVVVNMVLLVISLVVAYGRFR